MRLVAPPAAGGVIGSVPLSLTLNGHEYAPRCSCRRTCDHSDDGSCDDGGTGSSTALCPLGSDCDDCGVRCDQPAARLVHYTYYEQPVLAQLQPTTGPVFGRQLVTVVALGLQNYGSLREARCMVAPVWPLNLRVPRPLPLHYRHYRYLPSHALCRYTTVTTVTCRPTPSAVTLPSLPLPTVTYRYLPSHVLGPVCRTAVLPLPWYLCCAYRSPGSLPLHAAPLRCCSALNAETDTDLARGSDMPDMCSMSYMRFMRFMRIWPPGPVAVRRRGRARTPQDASCAALRDAAAAGRHGRGANRSERRGVHVRGPGAPVQLRVLELLGGVGLRP